MRQYNRVCAEIDLDAILFNMEQMYQRIDGQSKMIAVIKTDGYGHGAGPIAAALEDVDYVWGYAVACIGEAVSLRNDGVEKPILILGCVFPDEYESMLALDIRPATYTLEMAENISKKAQEMGKTALLHIKIDTGMGRIGFTVNEENADVIKKISELPNVQIEGMFTHFAKADEYDREYTKNQYAAFMKMKEYLGSRGIEIPYIDCDNSAGIIEYPEYKHDLVRAGISLYGMYPSDEVDKNKIELHPALSLISHVSFVKDVDPGTSISYGGTFVADRKMKIATVPVGYGDGYPRALSNQGEVLIRGQRAKIVGRVCMDQFMVDVSHIDGVSFMDKVTLIGQDGDEKIRVEELSQMSGRFNYELVCCLSKRIPREYKLHNEIIKQIDFF